MSKWRARRKCERRIQRRTARAKYLQRKAREHWLIQQVEQLLAGDAPKRTGWDRALKRSGYSSGIRTYIHEQSERGHSPLYRTLHSPDYPRLEWLALASRPVPTFGENLHAQLEAYLQGKTGDVSPAANVGGYEDRSPLSRTSYSRMYAGLTFSRHRGLRPGGAVSDRTTYPAIELGGDWGARVVSGDDAGVQRLVALLRHHMAEF